MQRYHNFSMAQEPSREWSRDPEEQVGWTVVRVRVKQMEKLLVG